MNWISRMEADRDKYIASIGYFSRFAPETVYSCEDAFLVLGRSDQLWAHLVGESPAALKELLIKHHRLTPYYFSVDEELEKLILEVGEAEWIMSTERYILHHSTLEFRTDDAIVPLVPEEALYIFEHSVYQQYTSIEYIRQQLSSDISACIRVQGLPVAWAFSHDDGSLGFLHVLPEHRGKGYGTRIVEALIHQRLSRQQAVFCNIVPGNTAPLKIVRSLGFESDRGVSWLKLKESVSNPHIRHSS